MTRLPHTQPVQPGRYGPGQTPTAKPEHSSRNADSNLAPPLPISQLWGWPVFLLGLFGLLSTAAFHVMRTPSPREQFEQALETAQIALKNKDYHEALLQAKRAWEHAAIDPARRGIIRFLLGSSYLLGGQTADPTISREEALRRAKTDLESARLIGVPPAWRPTLAYRLALAHDRTGSKPEVIAALLEEALVPESPHRAESYALLLSQYERVSSNKHEEMLRLVERWLMLPHLDNPNEVRLKQAKLLIQLQQFDKAKQALARIPPSAQEYREARKLWGRCLIELESWSEAIKVWSELLSLSNTSAESRACHYWLGLAYWQNQQWEKALRQWEPMLKEPASEAAVLATRVQLLRLHLKRKDQMTSIGLLEQTMPLLRKEATDPFITPEALVQFLQELWQGWLQQQAYELAFQIIEMSQTVVDEKTQDRWFAQAYQTAGHAWLQQSTPRDPNVAKPMPDRVRQAFFKAGHALARLAQMEDVGSRQDELFWQAGTCWLRAQDYQKAISVLEPLRQRPLTAARQWELLTGLGEAYRAVQQRDRALQVLTEVTRSNEPLAVRAKYLIALTLIDDQRLAEAEDKLKQLIQSTPAIPEPIEIRQARFALASVLYQQQKYEEAAQRFEAYQQAYANDVHAWAARYWWAESSRHAALHFAERALAFQNAEATQYFQQRYQNGLNRAYELFQQLIIELQQRKDTDQWNLELAGYLNSSRLAMADLQLKLQRADEAVTSYKFLALELGGQPEGLNALLGLFHANMMAKNQEEARAALNRLRSALANVSDQQLLKRNMNRLAWQNLILELEQSLP